ncbi:hypothetical protein SAMN04515671_3908 [Nakamurella panacisegetis]|uniref:Metallo-peptidase family M12B Reprolysin-like n=1 Tax=Nakamurella panacisegetis TaxID=1090615 RepID=A0A1H0S538_9ACTN|nr:hypothetical protein SAMN04515671_3908 [Nakamurella panacisegetis]
MHDFLSSTSAFLGTDRIEVWVCEVPQGATDPTFNRSTLRLALDPSVLSGLLNKYVTAYYQQLSHGAYQPAFLPGRIHQMTVDESPQDCLDAALNSSAATTSGVLAVATAENAATAAGGFGTIGYICASRPLSRCPAASTRRGAYVGASDFHPDWGPEPAVDLEEHELGHMLGWTHSGDDIGEDHNSGIDVMSNSAAPRSFDPGRRDGQDTLGINRLAARWLPLSDVAIDQPIQGTAQTFALRPSTGASGTRLLVLPVDSNRFLTVEYLPKSGLDSFFPTGGVTVTLIDQSPAACNQATRCLGPRRRQLTEVGTAPFFDLLTPRSGEWTGQGWSVKVTGLSDVATVQVKFSSR